MNGPQGQIYIQRKLLHRVYEIKKSRDSQILLCSVISSLGIWSPPLYPMSDRVKYPYQLLTVCVKVPSGQRIGPDSQDDLRVWTPVELGYVRERSQGVKPYKYCRHPNWSRRRTRKKNEMANGTSRPEQLTPLMLWNYLTPYMGYTIV